MVLFSAEDDSNGGVVVRAFVLVFVKPHVHVHLADVLVVQLTCFQIYKNKTFEDIVVEDKINKEVPGFSADSLLPGDKGKALAQFQHERLKFADDGLFKVGFAKVRIVLEAKEFQNVGVFNKILGRWSE